ncbi:MAG: glutamate-5-semialdehyde dehydrogenase [Planctomycetes bacterium]|nr:glutamate-5-semialdehyde dehydrogenase [Planctomycetota bacterium]
MALELSQQCLEMADRAKAAALEMQVLSTQVKNRWLLSAADGILLARESILRANDQDLQQAPAYGLSESAIDRLKLDTKRLESIAQGLRDIAALPDPVGECLGGWIRPNGLQIQKVRVPIGVIFFIYESRPNVTADAAGIAIKSGNSMILRGGKEAYYSSKAIVDVLTETADRQGVPTDALQMVQTLDRQAVGELLKLSKQIDLVIPRGGESLVRRVTDEATMPVLKHFDGNCHVYVDRNADLDQASRVVVNSKAQRMGVCNAAESLLIDAQIAEVFLPRIAQDLEPFGIELRGDAQALRILPQIQRATQEDWGREYLGPIMSVRIVADVEEAIGHINQYGSKHTDAIITKDIQTARRFTTKVDSAVVMVNASTRFNDGGQFGFGAEIGISTDKLHARGPCGLNELTTYKYIVTGDGHLRT